MNTLTNYISEKLVISKNLHTNTFRIKEIEDIISRFIKEYDKKNPGSLKSTSFDLTYEEEESNTEWYDKAYKIHIKPGNKVFNDKFIKELCQELEDTGKYSWLSRNDENDMWNIKLFVKK